MIRKATTEDIPRMIALQKTAEAENAIWGYGADPLADWEQRDLTWTWVAIQDAERVGFIYCSPRPYSGECVFPASSEILEIVDLVVAADARCRGLGHALVAALQRQALEEGFTHLRVSSASQRFDDIVKFYRSCGFAPWYLEMTQDVGAESARRVSDQPDVGVIT
jgi:GNAT superfamily N-acetyltransferase